MFTWDSADRNKEHTVPKQSKHYVGTACEACKRSKRKCDGQSPCKSCLEKGRICVLDEAKDGRRQRNKRTIDELYSKADAFDTVIESLRSNDQSVQELVRLIRSNAHQSEVVDYAKTVISRDEGRFRAQDRTSHAVMSVASLTDEPLVRVPAQPWTIIRDDNAVSHLISVYFTWHHGYPSIDRDIFEKAMQSKDVSSEYCTPLLVNSILAVACRYSDHPAVFATAGDNSSRGTHFLEEAIRLWNLEEGRASLANLQALPALIMGTVVTGKDRVSLLYGNQMNTLTDELIKKVKKGLKTGDAHFSTPEFQSSYRLAVWGSFITQVELAIAWMKPWDLKIPQVPRPFADDDSEITATWQPYPRIGPQAALSFGTVTVQRSNMYEIQADTLPILLSGNPQDSPLSGHIILEKTEKVVRLQGIEKRLDEWYRSLPPQARVEDMANDIPAGPLLDLHLTYNAFRIQLVNIALRDTAEDDSARAGAKERAIAACQRLADLFEWHRSKIGTLYFPVYSTHAASLGAYVLLDYLAENEGGIPAIFHTMIVVLSAVSHRWLINRGVLKMLWITINERKRAIFLEAPTLSLLRLSAEENWISQDHRLFDSCVYPNYAAIKENGRELADMGELLHKYSLLELHERQSEPLTSRSETETSSSGTT